MTIFIGADHGGFPLKEELMEYLQDKNIRVEDMGAYELDPLDDYPDFGQKVAEAVLQNPKEFKGIVLCRNGVGISIAANRYRGIRCVLGFNNEQISKARQDDDVNVLALPSDYITLDQAKEFVDTFLSSNLKTDEKYSRRITKLDL